MKAKTVKSIFIMCASLTSATAISGTNYVIPGNGALEVFQSAAGVAVSTDGSSVTKTLSGLEEKTLGTAFFKGMPKSAYKITISVKCGTKRTLTTSGLGQAKLNDDSIMSISGTVDNNKINQTEVCGTSFPVKAELLQTTLKNSDSDIETQTWIVDTLKPGKHEFKFWATSDIKADIATAAIKDSSISYLITPAIELLNVFIEPVAMKY